MRVAFVRSSANAPRPEPRTRAIFGRSLVFDRMNFAACSALAKSLGEIGEESTCNGLGRDFEAIRSLVGIFQFILRLGKLGRSMLRPYKGEHGVAQRSRQDAYYAGGH